MLTDTRTDHTMWMLTVVNTVNPYDDMGDTVEIVKFGDDMEELLKWFIDEEFNYFISMTLVNDSK